MSERGVFAVDRGIWSDPDFADEPFSEREAFLWLVGEAAWRPTRVRVGSSTVDLARGECAFSTRFMAQKWKWSEARVRRYLGRLKKAEIIDADADARATHITICKYDRFQRVSLPSDAPRDAGPTHLRRTADAAATRDRRKEEDRENTSLREGESVPARAHAWPDGFEGIVWEAYGKKAEKKVSIAALVALYRADQLAFDALMQGIRRQAAHVPSNFRPSLERFIKREKWTDEYPERPPDGPPGRRPSFGGSGNGLGKLAARRRSTLAMGTGHDHAPEHRSDRTVRPFDEGTAGPVIDHEEGDVGDPTGQLFDLAERRAYGR